MIRVGSDRETSELHERSQKTLETELARQTHLLQERLAKETNLRQEETDRQRRELAQWTDRDLHDVGLSRSDVAFEAEKPFWRA